MKEFTSGTLTKFKARDGKWYWRGRITSTDEDGSKRSYSKKFDIECTAPKKDEGGRGKRTVQKGKGYATAVNALKEWRQQLVNEDSEQERKEAEQARLAAERKAIEQARIEAEKNKIMLIDFIGEYIDGREAAHIIEASTATDYRHTMKRLQSEFGNVTLQELTSSSVQAWETAELKRGVSATTVGKAHRLLKQVISYAVRHEIIEKNVMLVVEPPKRPKKKPNGLEVAEAQRVTSILMQMEPSDVATAAFLALHASLRAGECCGLRWKDVDTNGAVLHVSKAVGLADGGAYLKDTKNDSSVRDVTIDTDLVNMLNRRRDYMKSELASASVMISAEQFGQLYVCGSIDGRWLNPQILTRKWIAIRDSYHIVGTEGKPLSFHGLRHAYATVGIALGVDVASIAAQMGHSTISQTLNTYTSATASGQRRAAQTMGEAMHPSDKQAEVHQLPKTGTDE